MHEDTTAETPTKRKSRGYFFLVDVPTFTKVCELKDADAAAAYLILAAGTGADNRTSTWSREAINQRTALNWRKAVAAIDKLEKHGFVRWLSGKGTRRPRLDLPPVDDRQSMPKHVATLAERIVRGEQPVTATDKATATVGCKLGWFARADDGSVSFLADRPMVKAYLPNALVGDETGKATGTSTIVDRIRLSRDPMALQLLVDLYALQDLSEYGGVDRWSYSMNFERSRAGATGQFQNWLFNQGTEQARVQAEQLSHHYDRKECSSQAFFDRAHILRDAGALEWVYYLAEDGEDRSNHIYPVAVVRHGKVVWDELETIIGGYATRAACALDPSQDADEQEELMPYEFRLPADRLAREATLVGVPRLRCRAKTTNAARWRKELVEDAESIIQMFRGIIAEHAPELLAEADRRLADFNAVSTETSTQASTSLQRDINDPSWSTRHEVSVLRTDASEKFDQDEQPFTPWQPGDQVVAF